MDGLKRFTGGLPGGPNEKYVSKDGYKADSPDRNNPYNIIPSNHITMDNVPHPIYGIDDQGNQILMMPGQDYVFPGSQVTEIPLAESGINIKPENKGKFTAKANAAGMGVQEYASKVLSAPESKYDPSTRKQANFAKNASKWHKQAGGPIEVYQGSPEWNNYQAQQAKVNAYNKWKSEHEGVISQGSTAYGTFAKNPLSGEAAPEGYAGFMRYKTPTDKRVPDNRWNWSAETIDKNTSYNYAPYMEEPKNLVDYKVIDSPEEADRKLREKYLADENIVGYKRVRNYNAVSGEDNYEYTPVRKGEDIDTNNFVTPDKVPNVVPSFQIGGPTEFEQGMFDVNAINLNTPFIGQPGYYDYSAHFADNPMFVDAQKAKPFATYQHNPYEEGTKEYTKQDRQNIKNVGRAFKESKKHFKQMVKGKAKAVPVFQDGGYNPYQPYENQRFTEGSNDYSGPGPKSFSVDEREAESFYNAYTPPQSPRDTMDQTQGSYGINSYEVPMSKFIPSGSDSLMYGQMQNIDMASPEYLQQLKNEGKSDEEIAQLTGYMQQGGYIDMELDDDQIASLKAQGYKIDIL